MSVQWKRLFIVGLLVMALAALVVQLAAADPLIYESIAVSAAAPGTTEDGLNYEPEDIIVRETAVYDSTATANDATNWYMLFEGDEHGLSNKHDIAAISIWPSQPFGAGCALECVEAIFMTFTADGVPVPGIAPKAPGQDVIRFTPTLVAADGGSYETYFDGSDVGLTTEGEKIDGLEVWEPFAPTAVEFPQDCSAGILFISTQGYYRVPAAEGGSLVGDGSDVLIFCATNLGVDTAGFWFRGFDNADEGMAPPHALSGIDVQYVSISISEQEENEMAALGFYFIAKKSFTAPGVFGGPSELFWHDPTPAFYGPLDDFNESYPALNGTAAGLDVLVRGSG